MAKLGAKLTLLVISVVVVVIVAAVMTRKSRPQAEDEIANRSSKYIQALGHKPIDQLSKEQRLVLMHSYYNLKDYVSVVRVGSKLAAIVDGLPEERKKPFIQMFENSYAKLSKREKDLITQDEVLLS